MVYKQLIDNEKTVLIDVTDHGEITKGEVCDNYIKFSGKIFSEPKLLGLQKKGFIYLTTNDDKLCIEKFVKLDEENHYAKGKLKETFDESYSSVTEEIVSRFIDNIIDNGNMNNLTYQFNMFDINGVKKSGTTSNNFIPNNYLESVMSFQNPRADLDNKYNIEEYYYPIKHNDYVKNIVDGINNESIFNALVQYYGVMGVSEQDSKEFIIQQAAFDILISNVDRRINSTNSVVLVGVDKVVPVNIDYGRALPFIFEADDNKHYINMDEQEWNEKIEELSHKVTGDKGMISAGKNMEENIKYLKENGLKKFKINIQQLKIDLEQSCNRIKTLKPDLYEFAKIKAGLLIHRIESEQFKTLWEVYNEENHI